MKNCVFPQYPLSFVCVVWCPQCGHISDTCFCLCMASSMLLYPDLGVYSNSVPICSVQDGNFLPGIQTEFTFHFADGIQMELTSTLNNVTPVYQVLVLQTMTRRGGTNSLGPRSVCAVFPTPVVILVRTAQTDLGTRLRQNEWVKVDTTIPTSKQDRPSLG